MSLLHIQLLIHQQQILDHELPGRSVSGQHLNPTLSNVDSNKHHATGLGKTVAQANRMNEDITAEKLCSYSWVEVDISPIMMHHL